MATNVKGTKDFDKMPTLNGSDIVPAGGSTDQVLTKDTGTDHDYSWKDAGGVNTPVQATATGSTTTTSTSDTLLNSMTLTPADGNYMVWFSASTKNSNGTRENYFSLYVNGSKVSHTERQITTESSVPNSYYPVSINAYVTGVTGSIEVRWRVSASTGTALERTLTIQKI